MSKEVKVVLVSFSGGRTSALMSKLIREKYDTETVLCFRNSGKPYLKKHVTKDKTMEFVYVFANTGKECEETLVFVDKCDKEFNLHVNWIETKVYHNERKSSGFTVVNFNKADRTGKPFEEVIKKYGIPNQSFPHCTRELKLNPIRSFMKDCGYSEYESAIGIRIDEARRAVQVGNKFYPLISEFKTDDGKLIGSKYVRETWSQQKFDLGLKDYEGNCDLCWKKSIRKKLTLIDDEKKSLNGRKPITPWWIKMEQLYGENGKYNFHRGNTSTEELVIMSNESFVRHDDPFEKNKDMDDEKQCACSTIFIRDDEFEDADTNLDRPEYFY